MNLNGKKLLILGGVRNSCEIIKAAKELGVHVCVTDYLIDSPGKKIADKSFMISTTDVEGVVKLIKQEEIDGILTGFLDSMLPFYNQICEKAGIPCYGTLEQFNITTDKAKFKEGCRKFDIPTVKEYQIAYPFIQEELDKIEFPIIIKPIDNSGGRGIFICHNVDELSEKYPISLTFSKSKTILIEKYMVANEATVFYLLQDGDIVLSSMADRHTKNSHGSIIPLPVGYTYPAKNLKLYQDTMNEKAIALFKSFGLRDGMIFVQMFVDADNFIFYEMGYRLTGSMEYKIIEVMNGINPLKLMIQHALTGSISENKISQILNPNYFKHGFNITFLALPGKVGKILGVEEVLALDGIIDVVLNHEEGEVIPDSALGTLNQVIIRVFGITKTYADMIELIERIHSSISVTFDNGENMLLDQLDTSTL